MRLISLISLLLLSISLQAGETEYSKRKNRSEITTGSGSYGITVNYPSFSGYNAHDALRHEGKLSLQYNRENQSDISISNEWRYKIVFDYYESGLWSVSPETLEVSYEAGNFVYSDYYLFDDSEIDLKQIRVTQVIGEYNLGSGWVTATSPSLDPNIPSDIHLTLSIKTTRYYALDPTETTDIHFNTSDYTARWGFVQGAESYDLEWVFIDYHSLEYTAINDAITAATEELTTSGTPFTDTYNESLPFELKEPTRVNVRDTKYSLDWIYPEGMIFFRVRAVGRYTGTENPGGDYASIKPGDWSYYTIRPDVVGYSSENYLTYKTIDATEAFATDQNWLYQVNFAEDGKHVSAIGYYDGSLRGRQNAIYNTSDDITLISENKYDYEGRASISIIPAPVEGKNFNYQSDFNLNATGTAPFEKANFDKATPEQLYTGTSSGTKGAGEYFSSNNTFSGDLYRDAIPNANGYVFSQVKFNNDGTGRVSEVAGIGEEFAIGSGHTTKYYYGTLNEVELKRLFGEESGNAAYYRKNVTIDGNGQAYAQYIDNHGRVIATALIGDSPTNLVALEGATTETITTQLLKDNVISDDFEKTSENKIINIPDNDYSFSYDVDGVIWGTTNPSNASEVLCAECEYILEFKITSPSGLVVEHEIVNINASSVTCSSTGATYYEPTSGILSWGPFTFTEEGEYTIYKSLKLDVAATNANVAANVESVIGTLSSFLITAMSDVFTVDCYDDCDELCEFLAGEAYNIANPPPAPQWSSLTAAEKAPYIATCKEEDCSSFSELFGSDPEDVYDESVGDLPDTEMGVNTKCDGMYAQLIEQISPGGVYYDDVSSGFWASIPTTVTSLNLYLDYGATGVGTGSVITDKSVLQDPANFQEEWLPTLYHYHREACHYDVCVMLRDDYVDGSGTSSLEFDFELPEYVPTTYTDWSTFYGTSSNWLSSSSGGANDPINTTGTNPMQVAIGDYLYEKIDGGIEDCSSGTGALETAADDCAPSGSDTWLVYQSMYLYHKSLYIAEYKDYLHGLASSDPDYYPQGCLFYDDDEAIEIPQPDFDVDGDGDVDAADFGAWTEEIIAADLPVFSCETTCDENVAYWMATYASSCTLTTSQETELEALFEEYCIHSCLAGNVGGWFYDDGSTEFDDIQNFFSTYSTGCDETLIEIDGADITTSTTEMVFISPCLYEVIDAFNANNYTTITISTGDDLDGCAHSGAGSITLSGNNASTNQAPMGCLDNNVIWLFDLDGVGINLSDVFWIENMVPSTEVTTLGGGVLVQKVYCDIYLDAAPTTLVQGYMGVGQCFENQTQYILSYDDTPEDWTEDCVDAAWTEAYDIGIELYTEWFNEALNELLEDLNCVQPTVESFKMTYDLKESQYTLFYYDQAGNIIATVPPEGVNPLDVTADFSDGTLVSGTYPTHDNVTRYKYNGLNELIEQETPDGGITKFYYDDLYRLRFSQNAKQLAENKISYTLYDELGRITEAGEAGDPGMPTLSFIGEENNYSYPSAGIKRDYVKTYYEEGYSADPTIAATFSNGQQNLRNRIGAVEHRQAEYLYAASTLSPIGGTIVKTITSYSYDIHGNVAELVQTNSHLMDDQRHKYMVYDYDIISGNVNEVAYQVGEMDEWRHHYDYDANNRLIRVFTSNDGEEWEMDTKYFYYLHGAMARVEKGHDKVQGTDYVYTLNGWLKGVNSTTLVTGNDAGEDGHTSGLNKYSGADAYGFSLGYFSGDYENIGVQTYFANTDALITLNGSYGSLYNGNITHMVTAMKDYSENRLDVLGNNYTYDQLQRIKTMDVYAVADQGTYRTNNSFAGATTYNSGAYATSYNFDKNGNLTALTRNDQSGVLMDDFSYNYASGYTNRLEYVSDAATLSTVTEDLETQSAGNYDYDEIGQLTQDVQADITNIEWTVTGKVRKIEFGSAPDIEFIYDAMGMRVMKIVGGLNYNQSEYTYYVYDASGNVMATYNRTQEDNKTLSSEQLTWIDDELKLGEFMIYGSKREGTKNEGKIIATREFTVNGGGNFPFLDVVNSEESYTEYPENFDREKRFVSQKYYELTNHLGNVLEVVTDQKIGNATTDGYEADIVSYSDYYPYGMVMPGRNGAEMDGYRYGFQGQEDDPEIKGEGNSTNYKYRMHDPRIGRFFATDPLTAKYPHYTPYSFSGNRVIDHIELEGLEEAKFQTTLYSPTLQNMTAEEREAYYQGQMMIVNGLTSPFRAVYNLGATFVTGCGNVPSYVYREFTGEYGYETHFVPYYWTTDENEGNHYNQDAGWGTTESMEITAAAGTEIIIEVAAGKLVEGIVVAGGTLLKQADNAITSGAKSISDNPTAGNVKKINSQGGTQNCVNCAIAVDNTLGGNPTSALPKGPWKLGDQYIYLDKAQPLSILEDTYGVKFGPTTINQIENTLQPGQRMIIYGQRADGTGHVFNAINQNGTIHYIDGQTGGGASLDGYVSFQSITTTK